ncbi:MAG: outer membrane lipoprotein chaperone LolA [Gammaproteobacteria bacterium]|nr:outer membrane lipoprotein chaperone LolA [Gammaproteobacteria bacterium]
MRIVVFVSFVFVHLFYAVNASASADALRKFLTDVNTLSAEFSQVVADEQGVILENSSGTFSLSRPGKFRWDYKNDFFEEGLGQQIVADGKNLFFYDPDLEQVSQRSLANAFSQVPSLLLVMSNAELESYFEVSDLGQSDALSWVTLEPKSEDAGYQQLRIGFLNSNIDTLILYDGLGNTTRLELTEVTINHEISKSTFEFELPEGADLLSES